MKNVAKSDFNFGDQVLISPLITNKSKWLSGKVIEVENNSFNGLVLSAKTDDGIIYFHQAQYFEKQ